MHKDYRLKWIVEYTYYIAKYNYKESHCQTITHLQYKCPCETISYTRIKVIKPESVGECV